MKDAKQLAAEMIRDADQLESHAKKLREAAGILDGRRAPRRRRRKASGSPRRSQPSLGEAAVAVENDGRGAGVGAYVNLRQLPASQL